MTSSVPKHSRLAKLMKCSTVILNILDYMYTDPRNTQVESVEACPMYKRKLTEEDLARQYRAVFQNVSKTMKTDRKDSLNFDDKYD